MPVRVKQRAQELSVTKEEEREWEILRRNAVGLLLAWHVPVNFRIYDDKKNKKIQIRYQNATQNKEIGGDESSGRLALPIICSVLSQAGYIEPKDWQTWVKTSARTPSIIIRGAISLKPAPTKQVQFISLGVRHLEAESSGVLYENINRLFSLSSFGNTEDVSDYEARERKRKGKDRRYKHDGFTAKQLKGGGKSVDRWPMFVIHIDLQDSCLQNPDGRDPLDRERTLSSIIKVLEAMITGFLKDNHFKPRGKRLKPGHTPIQNARPTKDQNEDLQSTLQACSVPSSPNGLSRLKSAAKTPKIPSSKRSQLRSIEDPIGMDVVLPEFNAHQSQHFGETFSNWSRIKSGNPKGIENGFLTSKLQDESQAYENQSLHQEPEYHQSSDSVSENQIPMKAMETGELKLCSHNVTKYDQMMDVQSNTNKQQPGQNIDATITWTNPLTKAVVLINARTGLVVSGVPKKVRSATANSRSIFSPASTSVQETKVTRCASTPTVPKDSWVSNFLKGWDNPVFKPKAEPSIPQISFDGPPLGTSSTLHGQYPRYSDREIEKALSEFPTTLSSRFSRSGLRDAKVVSQVDKKFVLVLMRPSPGFISNQDDLSWGKDQILVLIDQHAADERIRVEALLADLCSKPSSETLILASSSGAQIPAIATALIPKPLCFQIQQRDYRMFAAHAQHFANWGILYDLGPPPAMEQTAATKYTTYTITVKALPPCIAERCRLEPRILIELLRGEAWKRGDAGVVTTARAAQPDLSRPVASSRSAQETEKQDGWVQLIGSCPQGILDLLNSRSCRSAIMFNDELGLEECEALVRKLSECKFPFQCAHGRPSMVPLVGISGWMESVEGGDRLESLFGHSEEEEGFGNAWLRWKGRTGETVE